MAITLSATIPADGRLELRWQATPRPTSVTLLVVRSGAVPAYTSLALDGALSGYRIDHLSRHQRYLVAALDGQSCSPWLEVTPAAGLAPQPHQRAGLTGLLAEASELLVMPQHRRLQLFWRLRPGFVERLFVRLASLAGGQGAADLDLPLEPEISSVALDARRGVMLTDGQPYNLSLDGLFAGRRWCLAGPVRCAPAPLGQERAANAAFPQQALLYPHLTLAPELQVFEPPAGAAEAEAGGGLVCCHCGGAVRHEGYELRCAGCQARYIANGLGAVLELTRLRFGTCHCCLPHKILIARPDGELACAQSGKAHIRLPESSGYTLIEDLPYGLCQCCRPRRPLQRQGAMVRCSVAGEEHRHRDGRWVLAPSAPVFDAAAIDALLDAGLAEISQQGVQRARR